ncbi:MAG: hypothetical protein V1866_04540 [archaeon]
MAFTDDLIGMILVVIIVIVASVIFSTDILRSNASELESRSETYLQDYYSTSVDAFLHMRDDFSGRPFNVVLGDYYLKGKYVGNLSDPGLLKNQTERYLDAIFGADNYYMNITPIQSSSVVSFVFDGSESIQQEREYFAGRMQDLVIGLNDIFEGRSEPEVKVYILSKEPTEDVCFDFPPEMCEAVGFNELYYNNNHFQVLPPGFGRATFEDWRSDYPKPYAADALEYFFAADWIAGTLYATGKYLDRPDDAQGFSIHIVIPVSDKLSTNSIADECYNQSERDNYLACALCKEDCPVERSSRYATSEITAKLTDSRTFVVPVQTKKCRFWYDPSRFNYIARSPYIDSLGLSVPRNPPLPSPICTQTACVGCKPGLGVSDYYDYCFHTACHQEVTKEMKFFAENTGGKYLDRDNITDLPKAILDLVEEKVSKYPLQFGVYDPQRTRYVFQRKILLPNNVMIDLNLIVYRDLSAEAEGAGDADDI